MSADRTRGADSLMHALLASLDAAALRDEGAAVVIDLERGACARWRDDEDIYPASIPKIALMAEAFRRIAAGSLASDLQVCIAAENITPTADPTPLKPGSNARLDELIALAVERSDNIAANQLIDVLDRAAVTRSMRECGLAHFLLGRKFSGGEPFVEGPDIGTRNSMPPSEAALLLELIARDALPFAAEQRAILSHCADRDMLVRGLRASDIFMHKTGVTRSASHDAGILQTDSGARYVIVLYTALDGFASASSGRMATWMRTLRSHL
ncbi:MAG: serine hydrolase [Candidatus Eremiobacteraeota bacterium]|nr:serine hydrolase [Candidatus Eremiobacteraeota bacterium]